MHLNSRVPKHVGTMSVLYKPLQFAAEIHIVNPLLCSVPLIFRSFFHSFSIHLTLVTSIQFHCGSFVLDKVILRFSNMVHPLADSLRSSPSVPSLHSATSSTARSGVSKSNHQKKKRRTSSASTTSSCDDTGLCLHDSRPKVLCLTYTYHPGINNNSSQQPSFVEIDSDKPDEPETDEQELGVWLYN
jgi:hypothetical protein